VSQAQIRPNLQPKLTTVPSVQPTLSRFCQSLNGKFIPASGIPRSSESSNNNTSAPVMVLGNVQPQRFAAPGNSRIIPLARIPISQTGRVQVVQLKTGRVIAKPLLAQAPIQVPQTSRHGTASNACEATVIAPGNNSTRQSNPPVLQSRTNDNAPVTVQQQRIRHPGNQNRWHPESREAPSKK